MAVKAELPSFLLKPSQRQVRQAIKQLNQQLKEQEELRLRREALWEARDFLEDFVRARWEGHMQSINIRCDLTLAEVKELGHLPEAEGTRACRRLISVPVINDEIGHALWKELHQTLYHRTAAPKGNETEQSSRTGQPKPRATSLPVISTTNIQYVRAQEQAKPRRRSFPLMNDAKPAAATKNKKSKSKTNSTGNAISPQPRNCVFCHERGQFCGVDGKELGAGLQSKNKKTTGFLPKVLGRAKRQSETGEPIWQRNEQEERERKRARLSSRVKRSAARFFLTIGESLAGEEQGWKGPQAVTA